MINAIYLKWLTSVLLWFLLNLPEKYIDSFGRASYIKCTEKKRLEAMTKDNRVIVKLLFFMKIIMGKKRSVQADERRRKNGKSLVVPKLNHNFRSSTREYYSKVQNKRTCSQLYKVVNKKISKKTIWGCLRLFEVIWG